MADDLLGKVTFEQIINDTVPPDVGGGQDPEPQPDPDPTPDPTPDPDPQPTDGNQDPEPGDPDPSDGDPEPDPDPDPQPASVFEEVTEMLGYEIEGEFEDSTEGLAEYVRTAAEKVAEQRMNSVFEQYPELQRHKEFLEKGGKTQDLYGIQEPDFDSIQITAEDTVTQEQVASAYLTDVKGLGKEEAQILVNKMKEDGRLHDVSKNYLNEMKTLYEQEKQSVVEQQRQQYEEQLREYEETKGKVEEVINSGKVRNYIIPDAQKKEFFEYLYKPVNEKGQSQREIDRADIPMEDLLALELILFNKFKPRVSTAAKPSLSGRLSSKSSSSRMSNGGGSPAPAKKSKPLGDVNFTDLIN